MRSVLRHLRVAWLEYEDARDGAAFAHATSARLGFENAFAKLPRGPGGRTTRQASNLTDSTIRVRTFDWNGRSFGGLIAEPGPGDAEVFFHWVNSPAFDGAALSWAPDASEPVDLLAVSGHGSNGDVWGSRRDSLIELARAFDDGIKRPRSGRLKCLIVGTCGNLLESFADRWLPLFLHEMPVHVLLGYAGGYAGGATGAYAMASFVETICGDPKIPLIDAWRRANEAADPPQPWGALAAQGAEGLNIADWVSGSLPKITKTHRAIHYCSLHPSGKNLTLKTLIRGDDEDLHRVRWVMADGTVIDRTNSRPTRETIGLFPGQRGSIRIERIASGEQLSANTELFLFIYKYRPNIPMNIAELLAFDAELFDPSPTTGTPTIALERGRNSRTAANNPDALRIIIPADMARLELGFTVRPSAIEYFKADGPAGTRGLFTLDLVHNPIRVTGYFPGREVVVVPVGGHSHAPSCGAYLRS